MFYTTDKVGFTINNKAFEGEKFSGLNAIITV